jgi:quinol monooxygenase YgiN
MTRQNDTGKIRLIRCSIRLHIPLDKQKEALDLFQSVQKQIQFEPNCIFTRLYRDYNESEIFMIEELWSSDNDLNRHLQSDVYRRILLAIEMADAPPEIRFDTIIQQSGVEAIKKVRSVI